MSRIIRVYFIVNSTSMSYHITIMSLCKIFGPQAPPAECHIIQLQKLTASALELVGSLVLIYRASHGWKSMPVVMMHYFVITGMHFLHRLQAINENQHKWAQVLAANVSGLWHMHLSWPFYRFFPKDYTACSQVVEHLRHPGGSRDYFGEIDSRIWTPTTAKSLSSAYIIHQLPAEESGGTGPSSPSRVVDTECVEDVINALDSFSVSSN